MFVMDPEELKAVASHRWDKQHLTTSRKRWIMAGFICWLVIMLVMSSIDGLEFGGLAFMVIGYLIVWRWVKKRNAEIDIILERLKREG